METRPNEIMRPIKIGEAKIEVIWSGCGHLVQKGLRDVPSIGTPYA